jgi:hypothetical protein
MLVKVTSDTVSRTFTLSLTKDEVNALYRNEGEPTTAFIPSDGSGIVNIVLTTAETRDTFRKEPK